jgi:VWFA-related protein
MRLFSCPAASISRGRDNTSWYRLGPLSYQPTATLDPDEAMKLFPILALLAAAVVRAQTQSPTPAPTPSDDVPAASITVRSNLVVVPALVRTKSGQLVYTLKAEDFVLTDDGVEQKLHLEEDTGDQPLALVICVETGASGVDHLSDYRNLSTMLETMVGSVEHKVAVVGFDSKPVLLHGFTPNLDFIAHSLNELDTGDNGGAVLDGITFSVDLLRNQPKNYRRAILLLSETVDQGSHAKLVDALRAISDTNTVIYTISFATTKAQIRDDASKLSSDEPGPEHGCFTRDKDEDGNTIVPTDSAGRPVSRATQNFDCFAELLPPLRLAKIAEIAARNALRRNISASVARLTGGENFKFKDVKTLQKDMFTISNHIPNRYVLSFHPQSPVPGFHTITLSLRDYANLSVEARNGYWVEDPNKPQQ